MKQTPRIRHFGSDNYAGICPEALKALTEANAGHVVAYGDDTYTEKARGLIQKIFETDCEVYFVFNGTSANCLALASGCESFNAVVCHQHAHLNNDEAGAPAFFGHGLTLLPVDEPNGKLTPNGVRKAATARQDVHAPKAKMLTLTQSTEMGTVYSVAEIAALTRAAKELKLAVHMDGARFANALVSAGCSPAEMTWKAGVDVLSFGGTKNGLAFGEALVFFNKELAENFGWRRKQSGQLNSKMRFISAQWIGVLENGAWLKHAKHANEMAAYLEEKLVTANFKPIYPRQANATFVEFSPKLENALHESGWKFYSDVGPGGARLMCSWDTQKEEIDQFIADVVKLGGAA